MNTWRDIHLERTVLVVSSHTFLFVLGEENEENEENEGDGGAPLTKRKWRALLHSDGVLTDAWIYSINGCVNCLVVDSLKYTLRTISGTLIRWAVETPALWEFRRGNLPLQRGSFWFMNASHPRYSMVYGVYVRSTKKRFQGIPFKAKFITANMLRLHVPGIATPAPLPTPLSIIKRQAWTGCSGY
jgi:hypothetical protein